MTPCRWRTLQHIATAAVEGRSSTRDQIKNHLGWSGAAWRRRRTPLDAEGDRLCNARRYQRSATRRNTRAGHYDRNSADQGRFSAAEGTEASLADTFETAIIERYRRRESGRGRIEKLRALPLTRVADFVETAVEETLAYHPFPEEHWRCIRTNNPSLHRKNRTVGHRTVRCCRARPVSMKGISDSDHTL